jgi:HK97 family phage portal protein
VSLFRREKRDASLAATLKVAGLDTRSGSMFHAPVSTDSAQRVAAVFGCGRIISDVVATMPWDVVRVMGSRRVEVDSSFLKSPDGGSAVAWKRRITHSLVLRGNAYGLVVETTVDGRYPVKIVPVHPDHVSWRDVPGAGHKPFIGMVRHDVWPLGNLWHLPAYEVAGSPVGMNPIEYAASTIGTALGAQDFAEDFFEADAHPTALLKTKNNVTKDQAADIKTAAKRAVQDRDLLVLSGDLEWQAMQVTPTDSQFLDTQRFTAQQICGAIFGVPPEMLGFSTSGQALTYANATDRDLQFLKYGLNPWLVRIEDAMSRLLPDSQTVKFNAGGLLRTDMKSRFEAYNVAADVQVKTGQPLLTTDEMRLYEDLAPLPTVQTPPSPKGGTP